MGNTSRPGKSSIREIQLSQALLRGKRREVTWRELFLEVHSKWKNGNATNEGMFCGVRYCTAFMGATPERVPLNNL